MILEINFNLNFDFRKYLYESQSVHVIARKRKRPFLLRCFFCYK